jgi:hypothetical protein
MDFLNGHDKNSSANFARFLPKKGREFACNVKMWSHGIKRYPITTIKESFFFAFLSNTHTEIQLGIEDLM